MVQAAGLLALVILVGALAAPVAAIVLGRLPGAGLGLANVLGMLLVSWLVWIVASLGIAPYGRGLIVAALLVLALAGAAAAARLRGDARRAAAREGGAVAASAAAARRDVRAMALVSQAVLLVMGGAGMLFASFAPAVWGTEKPMDLAFMSAIDASRSFPPHDPWMSGESLNYYYLGHLTMAWPQKLLGLDPGAGYLLSWGLLFGLCGAAVFTVAAGAWSVLRTDVVAARLRAFSPGPVGVGLLAVGLVVVAGNLAGVREWTRANGVASYDWFATSRVIPGTINEIPSFSLVLGDLHAHVLAIPPTLLALAFALQVALRGPRLPTGGSVAVPLAEGAAAALAIGWLYAVNSWSYPVAAGMLVMAVVVHLRSDRPHDTAAVVVWLLVVLAASLVLILPFLATFDAGAQGIGVARERDRQPFTRWLGEHLLLYALPAWAVAAAYATRVSVLDRAARTRWIGGGAIVVVVLGSLLAATRLTGALLLAVACLVALHAVLSRALPVAERFLWLLIAGGAALLAGPEVLIVRDAFAGTEFERMNTVFKLGYQAFILLSLAAALTIPWALGRLGGRVRPVWTTGVATLAGLALVFPFAGGWARTAGYSGRPSLDGLAWLRASAPGDPAAIAWIRANVPGDDVVLEAFGDDYSPAGHARISSFTGRPTVLGWQGHELQWEHDAGTRAQDVRTLYATTDVVQARTLLTRYRVRWIVVGPLERAESGEGEIGQAKWFQLADVVFSRGGTTVWKVRAA